MAFEIKIGSFELRPGHLKLGSLLTASVVRSAAQRRFQFNRPDAMLNAYFLAWRRYEFVWEFPRCAEGALRRSL